MGHAPVQYRERKRAVPSAKASGDKLRSLTLAVLYQCRVA